MHSVGKMYCYQEPLPQFVPKQSFNVNNLMTDARNSMQRTQRSIQKLWNLSCSIKSKSPASMKPEFDIYCRSRVDNMMFLAGGGNQPRSQSIIRRVLSNLNELELQNIELGKRILAAKKNLNGRLGQEQHKNERVTQKDSQRHQQQQQQQEQRKNWQFKVHQLKQKQKQQKQQNQGAATTKKDSSKISNSNSNFAERRRSGCYCCCSMNSTDFRKSKNYESDVLAKYKGWNFKIHDMTEANKLLRPLIAFEFALKEGRILGEVVIQLCTVAAPLIVLEFVRKCMRRDAKAFKVCRIFPNLWTEHNLMVESTKVQGPIECDFRCIDHSKIPHVLSFAKTFNEGFPINGINFTISLKRFDMLNGKRVGFGHVVKGQKIIDSMQRYGSESGKPLLEVYTKKCYVL